MKIPDINYPKEMRENIRHDAAGHFVMWPSPAMTSLVIDMLDDLDALEAAITGTTTIAVDYVDEHHIAYKGEAIKINTMIEGPGNERRLIGHKVDMITASMTADHAFTLIDAQAQEIAALKAKESGLRDDLEKSDARMERAERSLEAIRLTAERWRGGTTAIPRPAIATRLHLTRQRDGNYMLTKIKPILERVIGTDYQDAYLAHGEPIGLRHLCAAGTKAIFGIELQPLESVAVTIEGRARQAPAEIQTAEQAA